MAELVLDSWRFQDEEQNKCCHQNRRLRRGPVTNILLWIECYASMVVVLSSGFPQKTPKLMAYQKTIVRAYRSFSGDGWVTYDSCYRRKAAVTKSLDWGQVDFTLYNETFTGRAKPMLGVNFVTASITFHQSVHMPLRCHPTNQSQSLQSVCTMTVGSHTPKFVISSTTRQAIYVGLTHGDLVMSALYAGALTQPHTAGPGRHHPSSVGQTHQLEKVESR